MKLTNTASSLETSPLLEENMFSISDMGLVFDILRSKLYSNKILAICREISCNARDAHREVGTPDRPIEITLPSLLDPNLHIKDYGLGISPDRMVNVFIKYAASTKRNDNLQTGGFGLGAKTPFAYVDAFNINVCHEGKLRNYTAVIDESKVGKLCLLAEQATDQPNGTEIIVPIKRCDWAQFKEYIKYSTQYWNVRPIIKGDTIDYGSDKPILEGSFWKIFNINNRYSSYETYGVKVVLDGIQYEIDKDIQNEIYIKGQSILFFSTGELQVSVNRENLEVNEKNKNILQSALKKFKDEVQEQISKQIASCKTFEDANKKYDELYNAFFDAYRSKSFSLDKIFWKDRQLSYDYKTISGDHYNLSTVTPKDKNKNAYQSVKFKGNSQLQYYLAKDSFPYTITTQKNLNIKFIINNLDDGIYHRLTNSKIKKLCEKFATNDILVIHLKIKPNEKSTDAIKRLNLDLLCKDYILLSDHFTPIGPRDKKTTPVSRKFNIFTQNSANQFRHISYQDFENEKKNYKNIVYVSLRKNCCGGNLYCPTIPELKIVGDDHFPKVFKHTFKDTLFIGISNEFLDSQIKKTIPEAVSLKEFLNKFLKNNGLSFEELHSLRDPDEYHLPHSSYKCYDVVKKIIPFKSKILEPKSSILNHIGIMENIEKITLKYKDYIFLKNYDKPVKKNNICDQLPNIEKIYPLLANLGIAVRTEDVLHYINLVDHHLRRLERKNKFKL